MSGLDELFQAQEYPDLSFMARAWLRRIRAGEPARVEIIRKRSALSYGPTRLGVIFSGRDRQQDEWDTHLSEALATARVKAVDEENEALRVSLMLADWFQYPAQRFGDDYFNCVLVEYLEEGPLGAEPAVRDVLQHVHAVAPYKDENDRYVDCRNEVLAILQRAAQTLTMMDYPRPKAERIFIRAVAQYLDDRFGVTNRRMLGLL